MDSSLVVALGERSYPITFGNSLAPALAKEVARLRGEGRKVVIVTDESLVRTQAGFLEAVGADVPRHVVPSGEGSKCLTEFGRILDFLAANRIDRSGVLVAVGGGVIGDLAGYAAASYLRGIDFIQVPTTLLSMVDSSVGGKTGINLSAGKNLVGAFHQPKAVFIDTALLATLPPREFAAGMAEVIKYGLLGDLPLFKILENAPLTLQSANLADVIRQCCAIKAGIVQADERELAKEGGRALLNLGHTFGHAIEQVTGYGTYLHGEAVAVGLSAAARLSLKLGLLQPGDVARVDACVAAHQLPIRLRQSLSLDSLLAAMARDKKVRAGMPRFVVLDRLGESRTLSGVSVDLVEAVWRELGAV